MSTATTAPTATLLSIWADGYGNWHARVTNAKGAATVARKAIIAELAERERKVGETKAAVTARLRACTAVEAICVTDDSIVYQETAK